MAGQLILEQEELRRELVHKTKILLEHRIPRVIQKALGCIDGKPLAGWSAHQDLQFAPLDSCARSDLLGVQILDGRAFDRRFRVIQRERPRRVRVEIVREQAAVSRLAESFGDHLVIQVTIPKGRSFMESTESSVDRSVDGQCPCLDAAPDQGRTNRSWSANLMASS